MKWITLCTTIAIVSSTIEAKTYLFPEPQDVVWGGTTSLIYHRFRFENIKNKYIRNAVNRYFKLIKSERWVPVQVPANPTPVRPTNNEIEAVYFNVTDNRIRLDFGVDESYRLKVPREGKFVTIEAATWVGALRALETFSQLIESNKGNQLIIHTVDITDRPTFPHRGILLDTARQFYPVPDILKLIDALTYHKMNVLHWHATDSQSWPLYFKSHPELSNEGAYSARETYNPKDVDTILQYGQERGVRVILELDMPAHTASIKKSHPDQVLCGDRFWAGLAAEPPAGQLNPVNRNAFRLVKDIVKEAADRFPDSFYHTGGDEINTACWADDKDVLAYLEQNRLTINQLWFEWTNKLLSFIRKETYKRAVIWEDPIKDGGKFPLETVVQTWLAAPSVYTALGHDVIVSNYDYFYLDCGHGGWVGNDNRYVTPNQTETPQDTFNYGGVGGSWCSPFKTWQRIYSYDMTLGVKKSHKGKILGGEVAMWSEQTGPTVLEGRVWPRGSAAAELYWSGSYDRYGKRRTVKDVSERFYDWVYRLQSRGINAEPVQPKYCAKNPHACDLSRP